MSASTLTTTASLGGGRRLVLSPATILAALVGFLSVAQVSANSGSLLTLGKTETIFAFGDSYTMTNYDPSLGYSPLSQNLTTSTGGNSWLGYLTQSPLALPTLANNTFNFARGGATIAPNATFTGYPNMSMSNQVDIFEKWFTDNSEAFKADQEENGGRPQWDADETLFTVWFGINDIEVAYKRNESWLDVYGNSTFEFLDEQVGRLYTLGARHFLFHLVPPYQLSPLVTNLTTRSDPDAYTIFKDDITLWNDLMRNYVGRLHEIYEGASAMAWETEEWFEVVLSAPAMFGFTNSTDFCDFYVPNLFLENASPLSPNATNLSSCGVPEADYFWLDKSHPTFSVHELLATAVANTLSPGERVVVPVSSTTTGLDDSTATAATEAVAPTLPDAIVPLVSSDDSASPSSATLDSTALPPSSSSLIDPSIPTPAIIPLDPNAGVGYTTLPNGDTLPTGTVWTKRGLGLGLAKRAPGQAEMQAAREEAARQAAAKKAAKSASSSSAAGGSVSSHKERPLWRTRTAAAGGSTVSVRPLPSGVPLDPNVGMGYKTLPNGDTIPPGKVWTRRRKRSVEEEARHHLEKKAHEVGGGGGKKGGMRKITPTMVNQEVAKRAQAQQGGEGGGGGIWEGVKERMRESVLHPAGLGVAV